MSSAARPAGVEVVSRVWPPAVLAVGLVVVWELAVRVANVPAFVLPAPSQVVTAGAELAPVLGAHVATTMTEALLGLVLGVLAGGTLALATVASPWLIVRSCRC